MTYGCLTCKILKIGITKQNYKMRNKKIKWKLNKKESPVFIQPRRQVSGLTSKASLLGIEKLGKGPRIGIDTSIDTIRFFSQKYNILIDRYQLLSIL